MGIKVGYFGDDFNFQERFFPDLDELAKEIGILRHKKLKIVLTMGSFDLLHIGHCLYLKKAKELGDVLIVGVETDAKVRVRKGPSRPVVPERERYEMVVHTRYVDIVTIKDVHHPRWHLIKLIRPDVLQAVEGTYNPAELEELKEYCGEIVVQPRQAETSTSAQVRLVMLDGMDDFAKHLGDVLPENLADFLTQQVGTMIERLRSTLPRELQKIVSEHKEKKKHE